MPSLEIHRFTPDDADDVAAALGLVNRVAAADAPWEHPTLPDRFDTMLRQGWDGEPPTPYLARVDGSPVGVAFLSLPERDNTHLAWATVAVHPDHRRRGHGSRLFERVAADARAAGRTSIATDGWESESASGFAARFGLEKRSRAVQRRQHLAEVDRDLVRKLYDEAARAAARYELVRITGRTPPELLDGMVTLVSAINDALIRTVTTMFHHRIDYPGFDFNRGTGEASRPRRSTGSTRLTAK